MQRITMQVDGSRFQLAEGQDARTIEARVVEAAREHADIVTVRLRDHSLLDVLITPGVPITFETEEVPDARDDGDLGAPFQAIDLDQYYGA